MRVLLYGMQSSGASAIAYTMAQRPACVAFVDIWNMYAAPILETGADVVAKVVVTTAYPLRVHKERFKPDVTILVLRHPIDNYYSLSTKAYANENGLLGEKFRLVEKIASENQEFDHILYYEDFVFSPSLLIDFCKKIGWTLGYDALLYPRGLDEIRSFNTDKCPAHRGTVRYGQGQFKQTVKRQSLVSFAAPAGKSAYLARACPKLLNQYRELAVTRGRAWHVPKPALLSCKLDHFINAALGFAEPVKPGRMSMHDAGPAIGGEGTMLASGQISITPHQDGSVNGVRIDGLPGTPFNYLTGTAYLNHPYARDTQAIIIVEDSDGNILAQQNLSLCHSGLVNFDLPYEAKSPQIAFYLCAMRQDGSVSATHDTLYFEDICLDYVPV